MAKRNYYEVLGVDRNASEDDIRRAYRKLARTDDSQRELDRAKALAPNEAGRWDFIAKSN